VPIAVKVTEQIISMQAKDWHSLLAPHSESAVQGIPVEIVPLEELLEPPEPNSRVSGEQAAKVANGKTRRVVRNLGRRRNVVMRVFYRILTCGQIFLLGRFGMMNNRPETTAVWHAIRGTP
jgi:hypothetical protein